jgi:SSS family solute:Na+ symporter
MVGTGVAIGVAIVALLLTAGAGFRAVAGRGASTETLLSARGRAAEGTVAASVLASSMGVWILLAPAEAGAAFGGVPAVLGYALGSAVPLLLFIPVGARLRETMPGGHSLTEYVLARFGPRFYAFVLVVSLFYMFTFLAAEMTGVALALSLVAGVPPTVTALLVGTLALAYTAYGGLPASLATDTAQALLLIPLLAVGFGGSMLALGGVSEVHATVATNAPTTLSLTNPTGVEFGLYVGLAVVGANMLNQGLWQRVWAAESTRAVRRGFGLAAVAVVPMVLLAGLFGVVAAGLGVVGDAPGIALFSVVEAALPTWVAVALVAIATLLVTSSADTMLNAVAALVTVDAVRVLENPDDETLRRIARVLTFVVAALAVGVGAQGYDVLALFLLADLLGAAVFAPFLLGLFQPALTENGALAAGVSGLLVGLAYFPITNPLFASLGIPLPTPSFLLAFAGATGCSLAVSLGAIAQSDTAFEFETLSAGVARLGGERR